MCGIVAMFSPDGRVEARPIKRAMQALDHRGPDGQGSWISQDSKVGLGHSRLSIIDLETDSQPIANEDNSLHVVVNGEFYDHDRIRAELAARGHHLATSSDSEIALHLYEDYGTGLMDELRGDFAFILWDQRNQVLIAARDRFGIKPLYYARHQGSLYLASEAKALFAAGVPAAWDHESFHQKIFTNTENDRSMFRGVRQVPPGHLMLTTAWGSKTVPYWDQNYPLEHEVQASYNEKKVVAQMHDQLTEATRLRMRADLLWAAI